MNGRVWWIFAGLCLSASFAISTVPASAQMSEVKEKPPMYSYVADWVIPRANWGEVAKNNAADQKILDQAMADGSIVGYGYDEALVHQLNGQTHDDWWSSMSMAGLLNVLNQFYTSGNATSSVLVSATKHWDNIYVSRYYNWHSGSFKGGYTHAGSYRLKADAPDDAVDILSKNLVAPLLEKLLADGTLHEYEIDTQEIHTEAPDSFVIVYIASSAEGLDKVNAAIEETLKSHPLAGPAFGSMVDFSAHRDDLDRTDGTYK
jgi:basic membrane lipoprotein Med (substrate-binding protein (PBP1-ABC) superfamily)